MYFPMALPTTEHRQIEGWATVKGEIDPLLERKGCEPPVPVGKRALSCETALVDLSDLLPMRGSNDSLGRGTETHRRCV